MSDFIVEVLASILVFIIVTAINAWALFYMWPFVMVPIFALPVVTYWQAVFLVLIIGLFKPSTITATKK